jgi:hypothetical protein
MKSRQKKKLKKIILNYWMAYEKVFHGNFEMKYILALARIANRYHRIKISDRRKCVKSLGPALDRFGPPR